MKRTCAISLFLIGAALGIGTASASGLTQVGFEGFVLGAEQNGDR